MEATGPYWKPIWYVLEDRAFDLKLVNAKHVKMVPGHKTDMADAAWLAELLEHGLPRGSFVPPPAIRELRDLTRYRKRLHPDPYLDTITGVGKRAAECILAEIGADMTRFPTAAHLASWAGMCPGTTSPVESAGPEPPTRATDGSERSSTRGGVAASHTRGTFLAAQHWRLVRRIGKRKAAVAIGQCFW